MYIFIDNVCLVEERFPIEKDVIIFFKKNLNFYSISIINGVWSLNFIQSSYVPILILNPF